MDFEDINEIIKKAPQTEKDLISEIGKRWNIRKTDYVKLAKKECIRRENKVKGKLKILLGKNEVLFTYYEWTQCVDSCYNKYFVKLYTDLKENFEQYKAVHDILSDSTSKRVYYDICKWRATMESKYLVDAFSCSNNKQYFEPFLKLNKNEFFVDCGAYIGDSMLDLLEYVGGVEKAILYETDSKNMEKAKKNLINYNVIFRNVGVGEHEDTLYFSNKGHSSSGVVLDIDNRDVSELEKVDIVSIDEDVVGKITMIKMDIEGMEIEALKGAINHIESDRPILAICLYHNVEDLWTIPLWVKEKCKEYDFYIRHYTLYHGETVLYAVPKERQLCADMKKSSQ